MSNSDIPDGVDPKVAQMAIAWAIAKEAANKLGEVGADDYLEKTVAYYRKALAEVVAGPADKPKSE